MIDLRERIKEVCKRYGIKRHYIAKQAGISDTALSLYVHNKLNLLPENERKIAQILNTIEKNFNGG
jgi:transcriptional regulator with XRE-family HTH domain